MPYQHTTHTFTASHEPLEIFWQRWLPEGVPQRILVFQHGIGDHSSRFQPLIDAFAGSGTAVYAMELPGHGNSQGVRGHIRHFSLFSEDLAEMIRIAREENHQQQVFLLGHSLGGAVALDYALDTKHQDNLRGLILSSPAIEIPLDFTHRMKKAMASVLVKIAPSMLLDTNLNTAYLSHDPTVGQQYQADPLTHSKISVALGYHLFRMSKKFYAAAGSLRVPTYIFHGTDDRITSPEGSKKFYQLLRQPDKLLRLYDDLYHETMNEREPDRQRVLQDLTAWVMRHS